MSIGGLLVDDAMGKQYGLAKKLKDAGFPQKGRGTWWPDAPDGVEDFGSMYVPNLEELIEAFGDCNFSLERLAENHTWQAAITEDGITWYEKGNTFIEATANLYIAWKKRGTSGA